MKKKFLLVSDSARGGQVRQRRTSPPEADKSARGGQVRQKLEPEAHPPLAEISL